MTDELEDPGLTAAKAEEGTAENYFEFRGVCKAFDEREVLN